MLLSLYHCSIQSCIFSDKNLNINFFSYKQIKSNSRKFFKESRVNRPFPNLLRNHSLNISLDFYKKTDFRFEFLVKRYTYAENFSPIHQLDNFL